MQYRQDMFSLVCFFWFCFNRVPFYSSGWSGTLSDSEVVGVKVWNNHIQLNVFIWVHMCICLRLFTCIWVHTCTCGWRPNTDIMCLPWSLLSFLVETRSLLSYPTSQASQFALGILSMPPGCKHFIYWAILQARNLRCLMSLWHLPAWPQQFKAPWLSPGPPGLPSFILVLLRISTW